MRLLPPFVVMLLAVAVGLVGLARPATADEEEEVAPKKPLKKVVVDDDTPGGAATVPDLVRATASAANPNLKKYLAGLAVACDRVNLNTGKTVRVLVLPFTWEKDKEQFNANPEGFGAAVLDDDNRPGDPQFVQPKDVRSITSYERFAVTETERILAATDAGSAGEKLTAAERVLTAVQFFHDSCVESGRRRGPNWEPYKTAVVDKLLEVRLLLVKETARVKDWRRLAEVVNAYADIYRAKPKVLEELLSARLAEATDLVKSNDQASLERARDILAAFENRVPNSGNDTAREVRAALAEKAKKMLADINTLDADRARTLLSNAKALDPDNAAVGEKQKELKAGYSRLVVGVPRMPRLMSPATAREDSEKMAVELLFEGVLDPLPDEQCGRVYRPVLALTKPLVSPLARDITVVGNAAWGRPDGGTFDAGDLVATVQLLRAKRALPSAEVADWLADPIPNTDDPSRVRLRFTGTHPDPRQLLSFKVLPGKHLAGGKKGIDDQVGQEAFARRPFGTGPFKLSPAFVPAPADQPVKDCLFVQNTGYRRRPGRVGEPEISEVQFVSTAGLTPDKLAKAVDTQSIHVLTDVPTADIDLYRSVPKIMTVTAAANRRIYMLAVNHSVAALQSADTRRGMSQAIDRDAILDSVYRAGNKQYHKPLVGPFPVGSWLTPQGANSLFNRDGAGAKLRTTSGRVTLLYPNDDPRAEAACKRIAEQVADGGGLQVVPEPVTPVDLRNRVEQQGRYDLAYLPFDFPDMWHAHALAALLDPTAAEPGGRNFLKYMGKGVPITRPDEGLAEALAELKTHRDAEGQVKKAAKEVWDRFLEQTPFIPLWQLDRHMVFSTGVKVYFDGRTKEVPYQLLDPITLFSNPSRWKLEDAK